MVGSRYGEERETWRNEGALSRGRREKEEGKGIFAGLIVEMEKWIFLKEDKNIPILKG